MKTLVFSDTHLGPRFEPKKYDFLKKLILQADQVIINGDFWEGYESSFSQFVNSPWKKLFPLLKNKKTVYVYGNHDKKEYADKRVSLFSVKQIKSYAFKSGDKKFFVEHGDRIVPFSDKAFKRAPQFLSRFYTWLESVTVRFFGMRLIKMGYDKYNEQIKKIVSRNLKENEFLICGHTSCAQFSPEDHYINTGWIKHGIGQYVVIDDGKIQLFDESY